LGSRLGILLVLVAPVTARAQEASARWSVREELRIGSRDAPDQALTRVSQVVIGPAGLMYVGQPMERMIRVFDLSGAEVRRIGRQGRGPGELEGLTGFGFLGDTLYVSDGRLNRVTLFGSDGDVLRTFTLRSPMIDDHSPPWYLPSAPSSFQSDGTVLVLPMPPPLIVSAGAVGTAPWLRVDREGVLLDTMAWADISTRSIEIASGGRRYYSAPPFASPRLVVAAADGRGLVAIDRKPVERGPATFRVTRIGVNGDTQYVRDYEYSPVRWDVLDGSGVVQATVQLSRRLTVQTVAGDVLVGVELDELDVPYIVRYRIAKR
jgi:hypothetical protein